MTRCCSLIVLSVCAALAAGVCPRPAAAEAEGESLQTRIAVTLGPAGTLAWLRKSAPDALEVSELLPDSPATGLLKPGDIIIGANGRKFTPYDWSHGFKFHMGYEGPIMDIGRAIEESEGNRELKGKLSLAVRRGGETDTVKIQLQPIGCFSKTWPYDCPKSDAILQRLVEYMSGKRLGTHCSLEGLALMSVNTRGQYDSKLRSYAHSLKVWMPSDYRKPAW